MAQILVASYWGPREESIEQCGERVARFFRLIAADERLRGWSLEPRGKVLTVPTDAKGGTDYLRTIQEVVGPRGRPDMGYGVPAFKKEVGSIGGTIGCWAPRLKNDFVLTTAERYQLTMPILDMILRAQVEAFDPDAAIVNGGNMLKEAYRVAGAARQTGGFIPLTDLDAWCKYKRGEGFSIHKDRPNLELLKVRSPAEPLPDAHQEPPDGEHRDWPL
jgi:hypothetical protein